MIQRSSGCCISVMGLCGSCLIQTLAWTEVSPKLNVLGLKVLALKLIFSAFSKLSTSWHCSLSREMVSSIGRKIQWRFIRKPKLTNKACIVLKFGISLGLFVSVLMKVLGPTTILYCNIQFILSLCPLDWPFLQTDQKWSYSSVSLRHSFLCCSIGSLEKPLPYHSISLSLVSVVSCRE